MGYKFGNTVYKSRKPSIEPWFGEHGGIAAFLIYLILVAAMIYNFS